MPIPAVHKADEVRSHFSERFSAVDGAAIEWGYSPLILSCNTQVESGNRRTDPKSVPCFLHGAFVNLDWLCPKLLFNRILVIAYVLKSGWNANLSEWEN